MGIKGNNLIHQVHYGLALEPKSTGTGGTTTGATIKEPWIKGRRMSFIVIGGDHGTAATATLVVQAQKRSDDSWVTLKDSGGVNDLAFTASKLADGGALEDGALWGEIDLAAIDTSTYKALRLLYTRGAQAVDTVVGAAYAIHDLYSLPSGTANELAEA